MLTESFPTFGISEIEREREREREREWCVVISIERGERALESPAGQTKLN